jgi:CheY-like chemotaxis protein
MQLAKDIRREIPLLRRCGRALTGDQRLADACVIQIMDEALCGCGFSGPLGDVRTELYRMYLESLKLLSSEAEGTLVSLERQAHWLRTVEEFCGASLSEILDVSPQHIATLLERYEDEAEHQAPARIQIIEDEALIAHDIKRMLKALGHQVTGVARTREAAVKMHQIIGPELIISDVRLADGSSGLEALDEIRRTSRTPVVFITALPEQLLTGTPGEPALVLSKPLVPGAVAAAVNQALFLQRQCGQSR